jgi:hypothetical protein
LCVVRQNCQTLDRFPELLVPLGVSQVHLDMLNPYDTGVLEEGELAAMMPRYGDVAGTLERMVDGFPEGFEVTIGSLPYCIAPSLAPWIQHDHQPMWTVTASGAGTPALTPARYLARTSHKQKPDRCKACVFDARCTGVFEAYAERFGTDELRPVTPEALEALPTYRRLVALHLRSWLRAALDVAPWVSEIAVDEINLREVLLTLRARDGGELRLLFGDARTDGVAISDWCTVRVEKRTVDPEAALQALRTLWSRMERAGMRTRVPPGEDAVASLHPSVARRLQRLRDAAPFGELVWAETLVSGGGHRVEVVLGAPGETATVWLAVDGKKATGGYTTSAKAPSSAVTEGLRAVLHELRRGQVNDRRSDSIG